jgi:vacuolar-type H+-ATPase subunit H
MSLRDQLIKLGTKREELRPHLKKILDKVDDSGPVKVVTVSSTVDNSVGKLDLYDTPQYGDEETYLQKRGALTREEESALESRLRRRLSAAQDGENTPKVAKNGEIDTGAIYDLSEDFSLNQHQVKNAQEAFSSVAKADRAAAQELGRAWEDMEELYFRAQQVSDQLYKDVMDMSNRASRQIDQLEQTKKHLEKKRSKLLKEAKALSEDRSKTVNEGDSYTDEDMKAAKGLRWMVQALEDLKFDQ